MISLTLEEAKEISESIGKFKKDCIYFDKHRSEWYQKYDKQFIAILNEEFVGADSSLKELSKKLKQDGILMNQVCIEFLEENPMPLILVAP